MRLPRDLGGDDLVVLLRQYGHEVTCQTGSHMRLTPKREGEHHITIPKHGSLRVGTLAAILTDVADHLGIPRQELIEMLFRR
jgi:predicted RNA binding protein YcfA (HicA-like mRNA interferase family)